LPTAVVDDPDADPVIGQLGDDGAFAGRQQAPAGALTDTVQTAPLGERQTAVVQQRRERLVERRPQVMAEADGAALDLVLAVFLLGVRAGGVASALTRLRGET
jgi:hypothetical protein